MPNSKKKGNYWENRWKDFLLSKGIKAWKDTQSGGGNVEKSDVATNLNINFEVKSGKQVPKKIYDFYKQSEEVAFKTHNTPYVVLHRDGYPQDHFLVVINNHDWYDLFRKAQEPKTTQTENRELQWALKTAIKALKKLLKLLE